MADTHETTSDIIAEMRRIRVREFQDYADRIEAAHKREAAFHAMTCEANDRLREHLRIALDSNKRERGDCAKLREALKAIVGLCAGLMPTWDGAVGRIKDIADAALSAPPRNCDRFATADEAIGAYRQTHKHMVVNVFLDWLFAPAAEKEGGAK